MGVLCQSCVSPVSVLCQSSSKMRSVITLVLLSSVHSCPDGWISSGGSCYLMSTENMNFPSAQQFCWDQGGYLVEVSSAQEQQALDLFLLKGSDFWIGLSDVGDEGTFVWQESREQAEYTNWYSNQPDGRTNENCVLIKGGAHN